MSQLIELMTTENEFEIRNASILIMKTFELRKTHL